MTITSGTHNRVISYLTILPLFLFIPLELWGGRPVSKNDLSGDKNQRVWIYLRDDSEYEKYFRTIDFPEKTLLRINKTGRLSKKEGDSQVPGEEIQAILAANVVKLRYYSRLLRAYSAVINRANLESLTALPIVDRVESVGCNVRVTSPDELDLIKSSTAMLSTTQSDVYKRPLNQLNILPVHAMGITGAGVRIGIIDTGFLKDHEAFGNIISSGRLVAEYDFINDDGNVSDETDDDVNNNQNSHGTAVWGLVGGYNSPYYLGAAYGAEFLLAKTERNGTEIRQEEDDFVAAVEWCDYWGADIVSVSLGYRDFTGGFEYSWEELDGQTAITTRAVNWAFERGILFVCCAGNDARNFDDGGILSPGDAFGALTVGAVDSLDVIASFSSHGPTYDGRIKPDLCAMGVANYVVNSSSAAAYSTGSGTSYATPLMVSAAALLLESQPSLTPSEIITELKRYADRADNPDDKYGWGIPDVYQSIVNYEPAGFPETEISARKILVYPNPANSIANFYFIWQKAVPSATTAKLQVFDLRGQLVFEKILAGGYLGKKEIVTWNLLNRSGRRTASGIYIVRLKSSDYLKTGKFLIMH